MESQHLEEQEYESQHCWQSNAAWIGSWPVYKTKQSLTKISTYFLFIHSNIYPLIYLIIHLLLTQQAAKTRNMSLPKYANMFTLSFPTVQSNSKSNMAGHVNDWERIRLTRPQCRLVRAYKATWPWVQPCQRQNSRGKEERQKVAVINYKMFMDSVRLWSTENVQLSVKTLSQIFPNLTLPLY